MLVIRLQRTGRSGHAQFRFVVQDKRFSPSKGRVVAYVGNYDPHAKTATLDSEKISQYLSNGAQPSSRVAALLQREGVKLPAWVKVEQPKERVVRNPEKRRSTAPAKPVAETPAVEEPIAENSPEETPAEAALEPVAEASTDTKPAEAEVPAEPAAEEPAASEEA